MWTGQMYLKGRGINWNQANEYCSALHLGGFSDWRLPTLDELKAITYYQHVIPDPSVHSRSQVYPVDPYDALELKGQISIREGSTLWTSSVASDQQVWTVVHGYPNGYFHGPDFVASKLTAAFAHCAICTRQMEPDLLQIAKDAQVTSPVPDLLTLKAYAQLSKARLAYQAGNFQESSPGRRRLF
jgi:hypothetical protein